MFQTSARMVMTGFAAVAFGAISGWILIDKMPKRQQETAPARASTIVVPDTRTTADEPPARAPAAARPAPAPASPPAATPPAATRVAAPAAPPPAATPEAEPAAKPASSAPAKPQIRLDPDRGEGSIEIGDAGISADKNGRIRVKGPDVGFSFDPEEGSFKVKSPKGTFKIEW
jgi:type IV secretory pathway VirB10-like protein